MSSQPRPLLRHATSGSSRSSRASSSGGLRRLPVLTVLFLAIVVLAWNLRFYQELYIDHAAAGFRKDRAQAGADGALVVRGIDAPGAGGDGAAARDPGRRAGSPLAGPGGSPDGPDALRRAVPASGVGAAGGTTEAEPGAVVEDERLLYPGTEQVRVEGRRVNGRREGEWVEYFPDGQVMSRGSFFGDLRDGPWVEYYPSGRPKSEGAYRAGLREGSWKSWHESGSPMAEGVYREARRVESWTLYYTDGSVMETGRYVDGRREGFWAFFTPEGTSDDRTGWYEAGRRTDR